MGCLLGARPLRSGQDWPPGRDLQSPALELVRLEIFLEHRLRQVTRTQNCKIDHCSCGAVHISVGSTTVRIKAGAARELRDALVRAMAEIDTAEKTTTAAAVLKAPFRLVLPNTPTKDDSDDGDDGDDGPQVH